MINKHLDEITANDIQLLLSNSVSENVTLEYKERLPGGNDKSKKEFLADVSSFANSSGGIIIFGISEKEGIPAKIVGISEDNIDSVMLRINNLVQHGIEPRVIIRSKALTIDGKKCYILKINRSYQKPHRVCFKNHGLFYGRSDSGKYQMTMDQIRGSFLSGNDLEQKISNYIFGRYFSIQDKDISIPVKEGVYVIAHVIPHNSLLGNMIVNINDEMWWELPLIETEGSTGRFCEDGYARYSPGRAAECVCYTILNRNGIVELVNQSLLTYNDGLLSTAYEKKLEEYLNKILLLLRRADIQHPFHIAIALMGVKGRKLVLPGNRYSVYKLKRDVYTLPGVVVNSSEEELTNILKPAFEKLWNAAGEQK